MRNETFRAVGFWGNFIALLIGLANIIVCIVKRVKEYKTLPDKNSFDAFMDISDLCFSTVLYKVSIAVLVLSFVMMMISFLVNTDGALRILMILCKLVQLGSLAVAVLGYFVFQSVGMIKMTLLVLAIASFIAFILYIVDRDHRKAIIRMAVFSLLTIGSGVVFTISVILLAVILFIIILVNIERAINRKPVYGFYDENGVFRKVFRIDY